MGVLTYVKSTKTSSFAYTLLYKTSIPESYFKCKEKVSKLLYPKQLFWFINNFLQPSEV